MMIRMIWVTLKITIIRYTLRNRLPNKMHWLSSRQIVRHVLLKASSSPLYSASSSSFWSLYWLSRLIWSLQVWQKNGIIRSRSSKTGNEGTTMLIPVGIMKSHNQIHIFKMINMITQLSMMVISILRSVSILKLLMEQCPEIHKLSSKIIAHKEKKWENVKTNSTGILESMDSKCKDFKKINKVKIKKSRRKWWYSQK